MHLLQYLHQVTEASWTLSATPMGTSFPIVTTEGHALGFLCMVNADRDRPEPPDAATLAALAAHPDIAEFIRT